MKAREKPPFAGAAFKKNRLESIRKSYSNHLATASENSVIIPNWDFTQILIHNLEEEKRKRTAYRQLVSPVGFHVCKACRMPFPINAGDFNCERELVCDSCIEAREQSEEQYFDLETLAPLYE